ncbi:MAG: hypothetical protein P8H35_00415 [Flavobacteriales bacterium]|nr:hypothetical protein [Flavobacteriales bacterium]
MKIQDIRLYTIHCEWVGEDDTQPMHRTVAIGKPSFLHNKYSWEWTKEEQDFDTKVFYYYEDYAELNQHLKDGHETQHDFIVTKIINLT